MNGAFLKPVGVVVVLLLAAPEQVAGYVGPGVGIAAVGAALAVIGSILLGVAGFVWYPMKRLFRLLSRRGDSSSSETPEK